MRFRGLRIAVSAFFGLMCLAVVALWVHGGWRNDVFQAPLPGPHALQVESFHGRMIFQAFNGSWYVRAREWIFVSRVPAPNEAWHDPVYPISVLRLSWPFPPALVIRHWLAVLVTAALAALPWLRWRFSLRTLLVVMTLVAVGLGAIVWAGR